MPGSANNHWEQLMRWRTPSDRYLASGLAQYRLSISHGDNSIWIVAANGS
jgi:hypothetical protein